MDTGRGYFKQVSEEELRLRSEFAEVLKKSKFGIKELPGIFKKGERLSIKDSLFQITAIGKKGMTLLLLPKESAVAKYPAYTADALEEALLKALSIACKDFALANKLEELLAHVGLNKIRLQWDSEDGRFYGSYLGTSMVIEAYSTVGGGYSYDCDFASGNARSFDEAEEIMLRAIMDEHRPFVAE
jgi:hypothetical protein